MAWNSYRHARTHSNKLKKNQAIKNPSNSWTAMHALVKGDKLWIVDPLIKWHWTLKFKMRTKLSWIFAFMLLPQRRKTKTLQNIEKIEKTENLRIEMNYKQHVEPDKSHSQTLKCWYFVFNFNCVHSISVR